MPSWALWPWCVALLIIRALMAAAESALSGVSDLKAKELATRHGRAGRRVLRLRTQREMTAASLRIGMVLSGFLAAGVGALAPPAMVQFDVSRLGGFGGALAAPLAGVLFVGLLAALADVTARAIASTDPEMAALRLSWLAGLLSAVLGPFARVLLAGVNLLLRPFKIRARFEPPPPPLEELERMLAAQAANQKVDASAPELIRSVFELSDKRCKDVMVPRTEVIAVEISTPPTELLRILAEENHSRIPVYREDIDHIVGVLHARDLIPLLQHPELIVLQDLVRPAVFVPWIKPVGDLLREMQRRRIHMAMVTDEYGGFMGVVTLEDILREIVGDIADEFEQHESLIEQQPDGSYLVDAMLEVDEFADAFGLPLPEGEYETLGGYLSSLAGSIPEVGEKFTYDGWQFTIASKQGPRLGRVRMTRLKAPPASTREGGTQPSTATS
ncbi:MAG TPA: hemolysin family protein [Myxococcaceae bacterium]|nr:hemolysin family protein [Myxococcaceae bacterium]